MKQFNEQQDTRKGKGFLRVRTTNRFASPRDESNHTDDSYMQFDNQQFFDQLDDDQHDDSNHNDNQQYPRMVNTNTIFDYQSADNDDG